MISNEYEHRDLPANAYWFAQRAIYALAQGLKTLATEAT